MDATLLGLTKYFKVEHLSLDSNNADKEGFVVDAGLQAVPINLQPSSPEVTALNGGAYGKSYIAFTTCSGILDTDRLTTVSGSDSKQFIVKGRLVYDYEQAQHIELYVEEVV